MNEQQIINRLVAAQTALVEKLAAQPKLALSISFYQSGKLSVVVYGADNYESIGRIMAETFTGVLDDLDAFIAALPDPETLVLRTYLGKLANAVDYGHQNGIAAEYVDPVRITQKAMSDNLLTADAKAVA